MRILGIDYGEARTGLAVCDDNEMVATVIGTIHERDKEKLADKLLAKYPTIIAVTKLPKAHNNI